MSENKDTSDSEFEQESESGDDDRPGSKFESEFESEFIDEEEKKEDRPGFEPVSSEAGAKDSSRATPEVETRSLKETLIIFSQKLVPHLQKIASMIGERLKTTNIRIIGKSYSIGILLKYVLALLLTLLVTGYFHSYYRFLCKVFDDSFLYESSMMDDQLNEKPGSEDLALLDEEEDDSGFQEIGSVFEIKNILLNIRYKGGSGQGLLKLSLGMELDSDEVLEELQNRKTQLKHLLILNLSNRSFEDIRNKKNRKKLKAEIKNKLNGFLKTGSVRKIFFTELIYN